MFDSMAIKRLKRPRDPVQLGKLRNYREPPRRRGPFTVIQGGRA
jgi:hypothetical protein